MADYQTVARQKARKYGLDPNVFVRQIRQESGFNPGAVSPAGAIGIAQIMPATARGWGVNPRDPVAALDAAAKNMASYVRKFGSYRNALVAYNAGPGAVGHSLPGETQNYIKTILGGHDPGKLGTPNAGSGGSTVTTTTSLPSGTAPDLGSAQSLVPLLQALKSQPQQRSSAGIAAPAFSAQAALPGGYQSPVSGGGPAPATDMNALLAAVQTAGGSVPQAQQQGGTAASAGASGASTGPASSGSFGKSHSPLLELIHNTGSGPGFGVKDGRKVNGSQVFADVWAGHKTHVHVAAGPKTVVQLGRLAQQMGLHVGENPHFGGVSPVHVPGSYHYKGEAIDVSGDPRKMNAYAQRVERLYGLG